MKFTKKRNNALIRRKFDLHFWIYFIICMIGIYLTCAMPVHASLGYYEVQDLYQTITDNVKEANDLLKKAFEFAKVSPFTVLGAAPGGEGGVGAAVGAGGDELDHGGVEFDGDGVVGDGGGLVWGAGDVPHAFAAAGGEVGEFDVEVVVVEVVERGLEAGG